jgi:hypothetical protein
MDEPVAWMCEANDWGTWKPSLCWVKSEDKFFRNWVPLYTAPLTCRENLQVADRETNCNLQVAPPPQREWVWLSDQDYEEIMKEKTYWYEVPKAVEIKSKEKNNGDDLADHQLFAKVLSFLQQTIAYSNEEMARLDALKKQVRERLAQPEPEPVDWQGVAADQAMTIAMLKLDQKRERLSQPDHFRDATKKVWVGLMLGVRVDEDSVIIKTKNNDAARELCKELLKEKNNGC